MSFIINSIITEWFVKPDNYSIVCEVASVLITLRVRTTEQIFRL